MKKIAYLIPIFLLSSKMMAEGYGDLGLRVLVGGTLLVFLWPHLNKVLQAYEDYWERKSKMRE